MLQSGSFVITNASVSVTSSPPNARAPVEHLEQHAAEGPDVGALVDRLASRLLGGHVGGGAENRAGHGHRRRRERRRRRHVRATRDTACAFDCRSPVAPPSVAAAPCRSEAADRVDELRDAEIENLHRPVRTKLDVGRLQIAMHDPLCVGRLARFGDLPRDRQRFVERQSTLLDALRERLDLRPARARARESAPARAGRTGVDSSKP